jgi:hypothetical protein
MNWSRGFFRAWTVYAVIWWASLLWGVQSSRPLLIPPPGFILDKPYALFDTEVTAAAFWFLALMPIFVGLLITSIGWIAAGFRTNKSKGRLS